MTKLQTSFFKAKENGEYFLKDITLCHSDNQRKKESDLMWNITKSNSICTQILRFTQDDKINKGYSKVKIGTISKKLAEKFADSKKSLTFASLLKRNT